MTQHSDIERLLDHWFSDGPDQAPDRVIDIVTDRIERQSQRPAWRLQWRPIPMNAYAKLAVAAAAVLIVAVVGYNLLPGSSTGVGGPPPAATGSPSPGPSATTTPSPSIPVMPEGTLEARTYQIAPFGSVPGLTVTFDAPAGWRGFQNWAIIGPKDTDAPDGIGIGILRVASLFSDPCHWDVQGNGYYQQTGDIVVGPTVDNLVAALRANTAYTSSTPVDITMGGYRGKQLDIVQPPDLDPSMCDREPGGPEGRYFPFSGEDAGLYSQGTGLRWHIRIVDVAGTRVVIIVDDYAGTPTADQAAAQAIVDSMTFTP